VIRILEREILRRTCEPHERKRKLENNEKQGDEGLTNRGIFYRTS
jgi:hypothetical protein